MRKFPRLIPYALASLVLAFHAIETPVFAEELSRTDKLRALYSNQFAFDQRGIPLITIGIAEDVSSALIESSSSIRTLPDGEDGSQVTGGRRWRIELKRSKSAVVEYFVILERRQAADLSELQVLMKRWQQKGTKTRILEVGTIFGVKGKVFDNRAFVLATGPYSSDAAARKRAEVLVKQGRMQSVAVIAQLKRRPNADLIATDLDTGTKIRVRDAIWFSPSSRRNPLSLRVGLKRHAYAGQIYVTVNQRGKLAVVNAVPADRLLAGLVPAEIFPSAPSAALRAQAVAARSDLLSKIGTRHFADPYLIGSWQHCQVYRGIAHEHPRTTDAISATRGIVLVDSHGRLVNAVYSAHCGGHTEDNNNVWPVPPDPTLRGRLDAPKNTLAQFREGITNDNLGAWLTMSPQSWCARSRLNEDKLRWVSRLPAANLDKYGVGRVTRIRVMSRGRSGRARLVQLEGSRGVHQIRGELRIRRGLGNLRSSMFTVRRDGATFIFRGGGWGHGVGMCQTGAIGMAKSMKSFRKILGHYYRGSDLRQVY